MDLSSWAAKIHSKKEKIPTAPTLDHLQKYEHELFGRKEGFITEAMKALRDLPPDQIKTNAQALNMLKKECQEAIEKRRSELSAPSTEKLAKEDAIDVTLELPQKERGHLHLIPEFIRQVEEVFGRMGFDTSYGPEIETEENNFNLLNIPATHPARDAQDTFWIKTKDPNDRRLLRTQTSPVQIRYMQTHKPPFRMICPGAVYRKDEDATHSPMFHQFEGLMIGTDVSLANMKAVMITAMRELTSPDIVFRFRTGYFPFVEPGLEVDMRWQGEDKTREGNWLEVVGCGMVHPQVLINCGINPPMSGRPRLAREAWQGFAFGFGVERMLMIKHQIPSIRSFYQGDVRFLQQF